MKHGTIPFTHSKEVSAPSELFVNLKDVNGCGRSVATTDIHFIVVQDALIFPLI